MDGAWGSLESSGFSLTEKLRQEFKRPHHVFFLFDTVDECFEVVRGLHDYTASLHEISQDSDILFQWADNYRKACEVERRLEFQDAKRCRLQEPRDPNAVDVYSELLGMDVKLQARLSRASYRLALANPHMSRSDLESAAREQWLSVLVGYITEADLPICKVAASTSDSSAVLRRSFGSRRLKTLRNRARSWKKVRDWLIQFKGTPFPTDVSDMLDFLLFMVQEESSRGRIVDVCASLAVLEDAGQVPQEFRISSCRIWLQATKSRLAEIETSGTEVRRAPPLTVAMIISLEISVTSSDKPLYLRAMSWIVLICVWACMRISDLEGLDPRRLSLNSRGFRGFLTKTKTTGPGKNVKEVPIFISRRVSVTGLDWLKTGYEIWQEFGLPQRDYFVFCCKKDFSAPSHRYASSEKIAVMVRQVFSMLQQPLKTRFQPWREYEESKLLHEDGALFWSGHSMRHFLPAIAAAVGVSKEQRDFVGRWHVNLHQSSDYIHTSRQIVMEIQEKVNRSICEGGPGYDESEVVEEYGVFLKARSVDPIEWKRRHQFMKRSDDGPCLGVKWPALSSEFLDEEAYNEGAQIGEAPEPNDVVVADSIENQDESATFFVSVSRRAGFRRLHRVNGCGIKPWACQKVEWIKEVREGCADAVCKICKVKLGKETEIEGPSSSGSSSSTEEGKEDLEVADGEAFG
jgi:integrase